LSRKLIGVFQGSITILTPINVTSGSLVVLYLNLIHRIMKKYFCNTGMIDFIFLRYIFNE